MLKAGAARVEITPPLGTHLAGSGQGEHRPAEEILDPLYARAVAFETAGRKACVLTLDVTMVTEEWTARLRRAGARFGYAPEAVMVHATQTHSAPPLGHFIVDPDFPELPPEWEYLRGGETVYYTVAAERAVEAIRRADASLRPATLGVGRAVRDGLAFNRRAVTRKGGIVMPWFYPAEKFPLGPTHISHLEGPIDPEVGVLCARDDAGRPIAALLHYTCHPVNLFATRKRAVSADWPGAWADAMRARLGDEVVAPVLNGCCGNINPWPAFTPDFHPDHRRMGDALAESAGAVLDRMTFSDVARLEGRVRRVPLRLRRPDPARLAQAEAMLARHPQPKRCDDARDRVDPAWMRAASVVSVELMRRRAETLPYEVQALRIGDVALVGLPGEPFVEGQLAIKLASPAEFTFVAHCTSQYVGYLPTAAALKRGGHEADLTYWAKLAPDSLDRVVESAVNLLDDLF